MPRAREKVESHSRGAMTAAVRPLAAAWKKVCQEAARPRCCGKGSSAISVRLGMASAMPQV